jgi:hypothetical protein
MTPLDQAREHLSAARKAVPPSGGTDDAVFSVIDRHLVEALRHVDAETSSSRRHHRHPSSYLMYSDPEAPGLIDILRGRGSVAHTAIVYAALFFLALLAFVGLNA